MNQIIEFFRGLLDTDRWPPRWKCGYWSDFHGWLYIISDLSIWLAYFLIPVIILRYFTNKKTTIRFQGVYLLFAAFILLCGTTHLMDAVMFWAPAYRLNAVVRLFTAVASLLTVFQLIRILPKMLKLPTSRELEMEIAHRRQVEKSLELANAHLSRFASMASHDLQEPLRKIQLYTEQLERRNGNPLDPAAQENVQRINQSAGRMQQMVKSVLTLASLTEDIPMTRVDLNDAVSAALDQLELQVMEKQARINVQMLPSVIGNLDYLTQLLVNLIGNALKFNDHTPVITITSTRQDDKVIVEVRDNGIGIHPDNQARIFKAFERLHGRGRYPGSGIGLSICARIMEVHHGTIDVQSSPGNGTSFFMTFTAAEKLN